MLCESLFHKRACPYALVGKIAKFGIFTEKCGIFMAKWDFHAGRKRHAMLWSTTSRWMGISSLFVLHCFALMSVEPHFNLHLRRLPWCCLTSSDSNEKCASHWAFAVLGLSFVRRAKEMCAMCKQGQHGQHQHMYRCRWTTNMVTIYCRHAACQHFRHQQSSGRWKEASQLQRTV